GLTVACAQCHDHKFDAISQREYYQLYAFFNNTVQDGHGGGPRGVLEVPHESEKIIALEKQLAATRADLDKHLRSKETACAEWQESLTEDAIKKLPKEVQSA